MKKLLTVLLCFGCLSVTAQIGSISKDDVYKIEMNDHSNFFSILFHDDNTIIAEFEKQSMGMAGENSTYYLSKFDGDGKFIKTTERKKKVFNIYNGITDNDGKFWVFGEGKGKNTRDFFKCQFDISTLDLTGTPDKLFSSPDEFAFDYGFSPDRKKVAFLIYPKTGKATDKAHVYIFDNNFSILCDKDIAFTDYNKDNYPEIIPDNAGNFFVKVVRLNINSGLNPNPVRITWFNSQATDKWAVTLTFPRKICSDAFRQLTDDGKLIYAGVYGESEEIQRGIEVVVIDPIAKKITNAVVKDFDKQTLNTVTLLKPEKGTGLAHYKIINIIPKASGGFYLVAELDYLNTIMLGSGSYHYLNYSGPVIAYSFDKDYNQQWVNAINKDQKYDSYLGSGLMGCFAFASKGNLILLYNEKPQNRSGGDKYIEYTCGWPCYIAEAIIKPDGSITTDEISDDKDNFSINCKGSMNIDDKHLFLQLKSSAGDRTKIITLQ